MNRKRSQMRASNPTPKENSCSRDSALKYKDKRARSAVNLINNMRFGGRETEFLTFASHLNMICYKIQSSCSPNNDRLHGNTLHHLLDR